MEQLFSISLNTPFHTGSKKKKKVTQLVKHSLKKSFMSQWANYKGSVKREREKQGAGTCYGRSGEVTPSASESCC